MTALTTRRAWTLLGLLLVGLGAFAAARAAPADVVAALTASAPVSVRRFAPRALPLSFPTTGGFFETHLAPRMTADARVDDAFIGARLGDPASRLWTNDPAVAQLVERRTIRSITDAFKGYAIEQLGIDHWTFPVMGRNGGTSLSGASSGVRVRLGFSRLAPRADVLIPLTSGHVAVSVDARGDLRATFDPRSSRFRIAADLDVPEHTATVGLGMRF